MSKSSDRTVFKTADEVRGSFREIIGRLESHSKEYERGRKGLVKDMSNILRQLLHEGNHTSLLTQLQVRKTCQFYGTRNPLKRTTAPWQHPLARMQAEGGINAPGAPPTEAAYQPVYWEFHGAPDFHDDGGAHVPLWDRRPFSGWWKEKVLIIDAISFTREELVLAVAHQFEGVHPDHRMTPKQAAVFRQQVGNFSATAGGETFVPEHNIFYGCLRQITYEVQKTIDAHLRHLLVARHYGSAVGQGAVRRAARR